jgi:hypothetical protein
LKAQDKTRKMPSASFSSSLQKTIKYPVILKSNLHSDINDDSLSESDDEFKPSNLDYINGCAQSSAIESKRHIMNKLSLSISWF